MSWPCLPMSAVDHSVFGSTHDVNRYNMSIHTKIANTHAFECVRSFRRCGGVLTRRL